MEWRPARCSVSAASVNLPLNHKVQKFSSDTCSPGWSRKKGRKTVIVWCVISYQLFVDGVFFCHCTLNAWILILTLKRAASLFLGSVSRSRKHNVCGIIAFSFCCCCSCCCRVHLRAVYLQPFGSDIIS